MNKWQREEKKGEKNCVMLMAEWQTDGNKTAGRRGEILGKRGRDQNDSRLIYTLCYALQLDHKNGVYVFVLQSLETACRVTVVHSAVITSAT